VLPPGKLPTALLGELLARNPLNDPRVLVGPGIGRDAAVIALGDALLVVKSDPITFATEDAPLYLVNVNANDLACLGATPRWLMVTALLPESRTSPELVRRLFDELIAACEERNIALVGGHTEVTLGLDRPMLVGMMLGETVGGRLLAPGQARPGDRLVLTRPVAVEGTALIARELAPEVEEAFGRAFLERCQEFLIDPGISIVDHAASLLDAGGVTALHDPTEGGLASGIREIALASGCGAVVNRALIPVFPETDMLCGHFGLDPLGLLASGSLLAAVDPGRLPEIEQVARAQGIDLRTIGKLTVAERGFTMAGKSGNAPLPAFAADEVARLFASRGGD
jgi:hydrogenase maturation factor